MHLSFWALPILVPFILICCIPEAGAQKIEREKKVRKEVVPSTAIEFISSLRVTSKIKWYHEESLRGISWEAKTKVGIKKYSIEFDENGVLEDIEIQIHESSLSPEVSKKMMNVLSRHLGKPVTRKIQQQLTGKPEDLRAAFISKHTIPRTVTIRYEVVADGKVNGSKKRYEYTFDVYGNLLNHEQVLFRHTDNLEF
jgi:hypothetical protein